MKEDASKQTEFKVFNADTLEQVASIFTHPSNISRIGLKRPLLERILKWLICVLFVVIAYMFVENEHRSVVHRYEASVAGLMEQLDFIEHETELVSMTGYYYMIGKNADKLSDSAAITILESSGAWYPDIILAQMQLESGNFKSDVGINAVNGFGMKKISEHGRHRPTTQIPGVNYHGYGVYSNWQLSVIDRILWEQWVFSGVKPSRDKYLQKIGDIYAEDPNYLSKINEISKTKCELISNITRLE